MDDTLEDLLQRLAGGKNSKTEVSWEALSESGLQSVSDLVWATETVGQRMMLQEELAAKARELGVHLPSPFVEGLRMAVQESRLAYSGFPDPPPSTSTAILFTAPHALYLQRPGHKPHKPEAYTQHLARDFAQIVGGAFLTWTRREEARAKDFYKRNGMPDATNADPNFTLCCDLDVSPWTRNLREVRLLFGLGRQCLHVDLHGCKDPGPDGGSDLVVGLGAMMRVNPPASSFFKLALSLTLSAVALHGFSVNTEPTKLTGVSPDGDRRTLTQQSVSDEGGAWTYAVQLELSRSLRLELSRKREMRLMLAKAILIAFSLAYVWQWKPRNCVMYPVLEVKEWLQVCKAFHSKRRASLARARAKALAKEGKGSKEEAKEEGKEEAKEEGPQEDEEASLEPSADAEFEDERGAKAVGVVAEVEGTANTEPTAQPFTEAIEDWWPDHWIRVCKDAGRGTAQSLTEWLNKAAAACGHTHKLARPPTTEVQVLRDWLRATGQRERDEVVTMLIAKSNGTPRQCYVTGTWCDWKPSPMDWDGYRFTYLVQIGENGWESFQIMMGQRWDHTVHPSCSDANPFMTYQIQGPDNKGHGKNWTIGNPPGKTMHQKNAAKPGDQYQIAVTLDEKEVPCRVSWKSWS
mmetsp:Transcript_13709/g.32239  ORF Transcript_13709/g.32239 Transcript_13709/m.32239 type:complete len:634 (+) Transcript_13709:114-2015(+)